MKTPVGIQKKTINVCLALIVTSGGLALAVSVAGCGTETVVTAAPEASRTSVHVKPAKLPPLRISHLPSGDEVVSLGTDVYFAFDSGVLDGVARAQLKAQLTSRVLAFLARPGTTVSLRGYTDGVGGSAYNQRLSAKRAWAARHFLIEGGAPPERLAARGFGEAKAVSSLPDRALRRVDVVLHREGSR